MKNTGFTFTKSRDNGTVDAWSPKATGNYESDCSLGNTYFEQIRPYIEHKPLTLSHVLQAMVEKGKVTGVEIGFLHSLSMTLASGAMPKADAVSAEAA